MSNPRIERMIRELKSEPAEQYFGGLFSMVARLWRKVGTGAGAKMGVLSR